MDAMSKINAAMKALDSKKAIDIQIIKIDKLTILGDYLILASGTSTTHVNSLADEVEYKLSESGVEPHHVEGRNTQWVLLDYHDVMVHVFHTDARNFYALERLWADGKQLDLKDFIKSEAD